MILIKQVVKTILPIQIITIMALALTIVKNKLMETLIRMKMQK